MRKDIFQSWAQFFFHYVALRYKFQYNFNLAKVLAETVLGDISFADLDNYKKYLEVTY